MAFATVRQRLIRPAFLLQALNAAIFLVAIVFLIFSLVFVNKPGPKVYYSYFTTIYLSSCLTFQCLQHLRVNSEPTGRRCKIIFKNAYWIVIGLCGLMAGIAFCFTPKPDCTAIEFLAFFDAVLALAFLRFDVRSRDDFTSSGTQIDKNALEASLEQGAKSTAVPRSTESQMASRWRPRPLPAWLAKTCRVLNRSLMVLHVLFFILAVSGAIQLALLYRFSNPGQRVELVLPNGEKYSMNFNCTTVPSNGTILPTFWLEADQAHGIVDFMGVQHNLAAVHGRNSCAYDPPNFGWSDRLPSSSKTYYNYFAPLLGALGKQDEEIILVGWGGGGEQVVRHAIELPKTTKGLVLLDVSPDGIEWMDERRINNWTEERMLQWRKTDLAGRVSISQIILSLGIPWGLMPVFIPNNSTGFFDNALYQRFHAQGMKEDLWAGQYYALRDMADANSIDTYLANTTVPNSIPVYSVMTLNASTTAAGNEFYRKTKLAIAENIAGGNLSEAVTWCKDVDCDLGFPVKKSSWTADALIAFGI